MKVAIVYQYYQNHGEPGHSLVYELTHYLAEQGHEVTVVSGETGYMRRGICQPLRDWRLIRRERDGAVQIIRTFTYAGLHRNYTARLLSFLSFSLSGVVGLWTIAKPDVVMASSPPIFPAFFAWLVCKVRQIPFVLEVRDLWPASAVQMGILKNRLLISMMAWMERLLYDKAGKIVTLTAGIREDICQRGWSRHKVEVVTCGIDSGLLHPDPSRAAVIRQRYGWIGKKIVLYFGALGEANNIPVILRAADRLRAREDLLIVLIGDGMKRGEIEQLRREMGLENLLLLPPVPKNEARAYLSAADLCLVTLLDIPLFHGAIPTKLIDYMACGRPVLCGVRGEAQRLINESGAGIPFAPDSDLQLSELIVTLLADEGRRAEMGRNGLLFAQQHFSAIEKRQALERILAEAGGAGGMSHPH